MMDNYTYGAQLGAFNSEGTYITAGEIIDFDTSTAALSAASDCLGRTLEYVSINHNVDIDAYGGHDMDAVILGYTLFRTDPDGNTDDNWHVESSALRIDKRAS